MISLAVASAMDQVAALDRSTEDRPRAVTAAPVGPDGSQPNAYKRKICRCAASAQESEASRWTGDTRRLERRCEACRWKDVKHVDGG